MRDVIGPALGDNASSVDTGSRPDVNQVVGLPDCLFVVLDDQDGIAQVAQVFQGFKEPDVIALVKPDAGFVEYVKDSCQAGSDLGGKPDPLRFTARQGAGRARQSQVIQPHIQQEVEPRQQLTHDRSRDIGLCGRK